MTAHNWLTLGCAAILTVRFLQQRNKKWLLIIAGFLASSIGDWFLSKGKGHTDFFVVGVVAFSIAHVLFALFGWRYGRRWSRITASVAGTVSGFYFLFVLLPVIGNVVIGVVVAVYAALSVVSLAIGVEMCAEKPVKIAFVCGIALLIFSDTLISLRVFLNQDAWYFLMIPAYQCAHISLLLACVLDRRKTVESRLPA